MPFLPPEKFGLLVLAMLAAGIYGPGHARLPRIAMPRLHWEQVVSAMSCVGELASEPCLMVGLQMP
jgi:hypothetical protein